MTHPDTTAAIDRAAALLDLNRHAEARAAISTALASDPTNVRGLCLMALAHIRDDDCSAGLQAAQSAIAHDPDNEWPYRLASIAHRGMGDIPSAIAAARVAVRLSPNGAFPHVILARALADSRSDLNEASAVAARALTLAPYEPEAHVTAGVIAAAQGNKMAAKAAFEHALSLDGSNVAARNELARLHFGRRLVNPDGLAEAAHGFAATLRTDPRFVLGRKNLDAVLRVFLSRTAYFIFVVSLVARMLATGTGTVHPALRLLPVIGLVVPSAYATRFVMQLSPPLRRHLGQVLRRRYLATAAAFEASACLALLFGALSPANTQTAFSLSEGLALVGRLILLAVERASARSRVGRNYLISTWLVTAIVLIFSVLTVLFAAATISDQSASPTIACIISGACALGGSIVILRRRRRG